MKKINSYLSLSPYIKINSRQITDLNVNAKSIKFLKENIVEYLQDLENKKVISFQDTKKY